MASNSLPPPPIFHGENYDFWAVKMKSYLMACDLWQEIKDGFDDSTLPPDPIVQQLRHHSEAETRNYRALTMLHVAVHESLFPQIVGATTAKDALNKLQKEFQGSERVRKVKLLTMKREFELLKMKETETVKDYTAKVIELTNQMKLYGDDITDSKVVEKMLISLLEKFEAKVSTIEEVCDLSTLTVTELCSKLQAQEQRSSICLDDTSETTFQAKHKGKHGPSFHL